MSPWLVRSLKYLTGVAAGKEGIYRVHFETMISKTTLSLLEHSAHERKEDRAAIGQSYQTDITS